MILNGNSQAEFSMRGCLRMQRCEKLMLKIWILFISFILIIKGCNILLLNYILIYNCINFTSYCLNTYFIYRFYQLRPQ